MKIKWEYHEENIGYGNYVAIMIKQTGKKHEPYILFVHELQDCYFASFCTEYRMFKNIKIPYDEVYSKIDYEGLDYKQRNLKALKYACSLFEDRFQKEANDLIELLT